jgi:hypothetical protein
MVDHRAICPGLFILAADLDKANSQTRIHYQRIITFTSHRTTSMPPKKGKGAKDGRGRISCGNVCSPHGQVFLYPLAAPFW